PLCTAATTRAHERHRRALRAGPSLAHPPPVRAEPRPAAMAGRGTPAVGDTRAATPITRSPQRADAHHRRGIWLPPPVSQTADTGTGTPHHHAGKPAPPVPGRPPRDHARNAAARPHACPASGVRTVPRTAPGRLRRTALHARTEAPRDPGRAV